MKLKQNFPSVSSFLLAAMAVAALAAGSSTALAFDDKVYPGSLCDAHDGQRVPQFTDTVGGIINSGSTRQGVTCPIISDDIRNTNGLDRVEVQVRREVRSAGHLTCTVQSRNEKGDLIDSASNFTFLPGVSQLNINDVAISVRDGYYVMLCSLPNGAQVISYKVREEESS